MNVKSNGSMQGEQITAQESPKPPLITVNVSRDGMEAQICLRKNGENTAFPLFEDLMAALAAKKVCFGINETVLRTLCENAVFDRSFVVASGVQPKTGNDGYLKYLVEETRELRPKLRENGTVDYRDLGLIQNVRKGQAVCEIHKPEKGEDGCDVLGNVIAGKMGREPYNPQGRNTELNAQGTLLLASVDGNVEVKRGTINIVDSLRIKGNIDNSTGDINFVGDVTIDGDVVSGFRVISQGSITIKGSVEGATIQADGDVMVGEGINGMNRGSVIAGKNIRCKYIQSCYIQSGENIYADSIMYCTVECSGNLEMEGKRAVLIGGRTSVAGKLIAKTIGSDSHVATYITMASTGTHKNKEIYELTGKLKSIDAENVKLVQIMTRFEDLVSQGRATEEHAASVQQVKAKYLEQADKREEVQRRLEQVKQEQLEASRENSCIECKGKVNAGVQITFGPLTMAVQHSFVNSRILIVDGEITTATL